jgi:lipopolysaccharide biosynthesis glycosyltransferase
VTPYRLFIGHDPNEMRAWNVAQFSAHATSTVPLEIRRVSMLELSVRGLYTRPTETRSAGYWDVISDAPMSTAHAIARFLVPRLCEYVGWALFTDGDVMFRRDVGELFSLADPRYAVQVVLHDHQPTATEKMQGHAQTAYPRKNQSSVMLFQCGHPSNRALTPELVNSVPGRDLHRFCWLKDEEIGALPPRWNHLVGHSAATTDVAICHFTSGVPDMPGYEHVPFSDDWYAYARSVGYRLNRPAKQERVAV